MSCDLDDYVLGDAYLDEIIQAPIIILFGLPRGLYIFESFRAERGHTRRWIAQISELAPLKYERLARMLAKIKDNPLEGKAVLTLLSASTSRSEIDGIIDDFLGGVLFQPTSLSLR